MLIKPSGRSFGITSCFFSLLADQPGGWIQETLIHDFLVTSAGFALRACCLIWAHSQKINCWFPLHFVSMPWESWDRCPAHSLLSLPHPIPFSSLASGMTNFPSLHVKNAENELLVTLRKGTWVRCSQFVPTSFGTSESQTSTPAMEQQQNFAQRTSGGDYPVLACPVLARMPSVPRYWGQPDSSCSSSHSFKLNKSTTQSLHLNLAMVVATILFPPTWSSL